MNKNRKIWAIILLFILAAIAIVFLYKAYQGIHLKAGPGVGCYYVFKTDQNYKNLVVIQLDGSDSYKVVYKNLFAQAKELNDDYIMHASYNCYPDFAKDHFFVNISQEGYDQIDWSKDAETVVYHMKDLLLEDSFTEFYYCLDFAGTVSISAINDLIDQDQLLAICQQTK